MKVKELTIISFEKLNKKIFLNSTLSIKKIPLLNEEKPIIFPFFEAKINACGAL